MIKLSYYVLRKLVWSLADLILFTVSIFHILKGKDFSDYLVVGINTEEWLTNKKGQYFQSWVERAEIITS